MSTKNQIILPADIYDTLEMVAMEFGGVGGERFFQLRKNNEPVPCCIHGMMNYALPLEIANLNANAVLGGCVEYFEGWWEELNQYITPEMNNKAVEQINEKKDVPWYYGERVSWGEYCKELNIVRGS